MAGLPQKSVKGANLKKWLIEAVDGIIDYLKSGIYLVPGPGISIERKPSGIVISATKPSVSVSPSVKAAASSVQDISATVTGGTATIMLSGSTSSVPVVAGSNVNITGGTNGEVIIGATGGTGTVGFPDMLNGSTVSSGTNYPVTSDSWLIGHVGIYGDSSLNYPTRLSGVVELKVSATGTSQSNTISLYVNQGLYEVSQSGLNGWYPVCIPIRAGYTIRLNISGSARTDIYLYPI
jgi:hypothetical protein